MTLRIKAATNRSEHVAADCDAIYATLESVEEPKRLFPRINQCVNPEDNGYHCWLGPLGTQNYQLPLDYVTQWEFEDTQRTIRWRLLDYGRSRTHLSGA